VIEGNATLSMLDEKTDKKMDNPDTLMFQKRVWDSA
jgi:hypothetical protein